MNDYLSCIKALESKIVILEQENDALSAKTEENLVLYRAFEEINTHDENDGFIYHTLEDISILLDVPFCGVFEINEGELFFLEHYALFAHEEAPHINLTFSAEVVEKICLKTALFLRCAQKDFAFTYAKSDFSPSCAVVIPFDSVQTRNRFFIFIDTDAHAIMKEKISLFERIVGIMVARYEKLYYQNELKFLNATLEDKIVLRTRELEEKNTELQKAKEHVEQSEERLSITLHSIGDGVISTDKQGLVVDMNPVAERLCGWSFDAAKGKLLSDIFTIINAESRIPCENPVAKVLEYGKTVGLANHTVLIAKDGQEYQIADSAAPIRDSKGEIRGVVLVISDVTEKYAQEEKLRNAQEELCLSLKNQLYSDELTKLRSRVCLLEDIKKAHNPSVILIDINSFRTINELYGIEVGNEVLVVFSTMLEAFARTTDFAVYRTAGDEFVLFKDTQEGDDICGNFLSSLFEMAEKTPIHVSLLGEALYLDISVGASCEKDNPLATANIALHYAKERYKPYCIYDNEIDAFKEILYGAKWKKKIRIGIQEDAFLPFFQPIVDKHKTVVKYEALMRFAELNGETSYVAPFHFLDIAIKTRYYGEISQMTLLKSLHVCAVQKITVSLNLNYHDILNEPLKELLKQTISEKKIAKRVIFEIVESENIQDYKILKAFIEEFKLLGVRFAIDDFGTGFSNFSHIFELTPDFIKIDGSLIKNIDTDKKSYELVKAIVFFCKQLDIQTVAEFVHSKEVFEVALSLGIDFFQGYYFGKPKQRT